MNAFTDTISKFILEIPDSQVNVGFFSDEEDLVKNFLDRTKEMQNIQSIMLISDFHNNVFNKYPKVGRMSREEISNSNTDIYIFLDFKGTQLVIGIQEYSFFENKRYFRDHCKNMYFYRYNGSPIRCGYWKYKNNIASDLQVLELSKWGEIVQNMPDPYLLTELQNKESSTLYINKLSDFFDKFIKKVMLTDNTNNEEIQRILNVTLEQYSISALVMAFTHPAISEINYENNEHRGDRLAISLFSEAMHKKYSRLTPAEASEYALHYNSAEIQSIFSDDLKLVDRMIRPRFINAKNNDLKSDIFESFLGCIARIFNELKDGAQFVICYKIMSYIVDSLPFDRRIIRGKNKKQVLEVLKLYLPIKKNAIRANFEETAVNENAAVNFVYSNEFAKFMKDKGKTKLLSDIETVIIEYDHKTEHRKDAEEKGWGKILEILKSNDFSQENAKSVDLKDINIIRDNEPDIYNLFVQRLTSEYENDINTLISRLEFQVNKFENYISMSILMYNIGSYGERFTNISVPIIDNQREEETYDRTLDIFIENAKLACVPFPDVVPDEYKKLKNPKVYGKFLAIKQYVETGGLTVR